MKYDVLAASASSASRNTTTSQRYVRQKPALFVFSLSMIRFANVSLRAKTTHVTRIRFTESR